MDLTLQLWGGGCYLANKILFSLAEGREQSHKRTLQIWGWSLYIVGVPAWVVILISQNDWIAASIETGGIPAMLLGLYNVITSNQKPHKGYDLFVSIATYTALVFGVSYSVYLHGGLNSLTQILEVFVTMGFLLGSYFLAKGNRNGWLFFMLMNISMAGLMFLQDKPILMAQQLISLCFVIWGYTKIVRSDRHP